MGFGELPLELIPEVIDSYTIIPQNELEELVMQWSCLPYGYRVYQFSSLNRHWRDGIMHSHSESPRVYTPIKSHAHTAYSTKNFKIRNDSDIDDLETWISAPGRKEHMKGAVSLDVYDKWSYDTLREEGEALADLSLYSFTLRSQKENYYFELPHNLRTSRLILKGFDIGPRAVVDVPFPASLCDHLTYLELESVCFYGLEDLKSKNISFKRLKHFKWEHNDLVFTDTRLMLELMTNLEKLELLVDSSEIEKPLFPLPSSMPHLKHLEARFLSLDFSQYQLPSLTHLKCTFCGALNLKALDNTLQSLEAHDTSFGPDSDIYSPDGLAKLSSIKRLCVWISYDTVKRSGERSVFHTKFEAGYFDTAFPELETLDIAPTFDIIDSNAVVRFAQAHCKLHTLVVSRSLKRKLPPINANVVVSREYEDEDDSDGDY